MDSDLSDAAARTRPLDLGHPHGLYRLVTGGGTRPITQADYQLLAQDAVVLAEDYAA
jgi:hypothetical protein